MTITFFRKKTEGKKRANVILIIRQRKKQKWIDTHISIEEKQWCRKTKKVKQGPNKAHLNRRLDIIEMNAKNKLYELSQDHLPSIYELYDAITKRDPKSDLSVNLILKEFARHKTLIKSYKYAESILNTERLISKFRGEIQASEFNKKTLQEFRNFYFEEVGTKENGLAANLRSLRAALNWYNDNYDTTIDTSVFKNQIKTNKTIKKAISKDVIKKLFNLELKQRILARDTFLLIYRMQGINFIDLVTLTRENFINERTFIYDRKKNRRKSSSPNYIQVTIADDIWPIWEKYLNQNNSPFILPWISEHPEASALAYKAYQGRKRQFDRAMKVIAKKIGYEGSLSSYVARHSWGTHLKMANVPLQAIQQGYGHSSSKMTEIYLDYYNADDLNKTFNDITSLD